MTRSSSRSERSLTVAATRTRAPATRTRGGRDVYDRTSVLAEEPFHPLGDRYVEMGEERSGVPQARSRPVCRGGPRDPSVDVRTRHAEHLGDVGHESEVAHEHRGEARHARDPQLVGDAVEPGREASLVGYRPVEDPPTNPAREQALQGDAEATLGWDEPPTLEHRGQEGAGVLGDEGDAGDLRREQRGQGPSGDGRGDAALPEEVRLEGHVVPDLVDAPHARLPGPHVGDGRHEPCHPLAVPPGAEDGDVHAVVA
jgi:hypothetical protein